MNWPLFLQLMKLILKIFVTGKEFWFRTRFASCFAESSLEKLWDKIISTSCEFDVLVALGLLKFNKNKIIEMEPQQVTHHLRNIEISEKEAEVVISKALEYHSILNNEDPLSSTMNLQNNKKQNHLPAKVPKQNPKQKKT